MIHYTVCPVCNAKTIKPEFFSKDFTVTGQEFPVWSCYNCAAMFTQDVPAGEAMGKYYQSENYVSHSDIQKGFINRMYHRIRKRTLIKKMQLIRDETGFSGGNILDVGCGTGAFLNTMQLAGWKITGLEPHEGARKTAQALYNIHALAAKKIFELPQQNFDVITLWHVIEHVHQLHEYVEQLKKMITAEGRIFIAVPNCTSYDAAVYKSHWAAYDVPRHLYHFSPNSMSALMQQHGMRVRKMKPMWFDSFYVSMLSEQYKNGKANILKAVLVGLISNLKAVFNTTACSSVIYIISLNNEA